MEREPDCAAKHRDDTAPDQLGAMIISPEEETDNRNEKRREQKFNRQAECRGECDPDELDSANIDEWHSRADPRLIILASGKRQILRIAY